MPDILPESERQPGILSRVLQRMKALHADSAGEKSDEERIMEGMSSQIIGETTQKALRALIRQEAKRLAEMKDREGWDDSELAQRIANMKQRVTEEMYQNHWFESTLSTTDAPINSATFGSWTFRFDLRKLMAENPSPERMKEFGWIMFDVDGLRSFKDCTSHEHTTHFLQQIVRILVDPNGPTNKRIQEAGVRVIPMATGGDEFVLYLRGSAPLTPAFIDDIITSFQREVSTSEILRSFLNYDDESVLVTYGLPSRQQRKEFAQLPDEERAEQLREIRATLPEQFNPSIAGGGALLGEGILRAVERDEHDLQGSDQTFQSLRETIVNSTIDLAEARQKKNKELALKQLEHEHPRQYKFRLRNSENRQLQYAKERLEEELASVRIQLAQILNLRGETSAPMAITFFVEEQNPTVTYTT